MPTYEYECDNCHHERPDEGQQQSEPPSALSPDEHDTRDCAQHQTRTQLPPGGLHAGSEPSREEHHADESQPGWVGIPGSLQVSQRPASSSCGEFAGGYAVH